MSQIPQTEEVPACIARVISLGKMLYECTSDFILKPFTTEIDIEQLKIYVSSKYNTHNINRMA